VCLHYLYEVVALMWWVVFGFAVRIIDVRKPLQLLLELLMCARSTQVRKQTAARLRQRRDSITHKRTLGKRGSYRFVTNVVETERKRLACACSGLGEASGGLGAVGGGGHPHRPADAAAGGKTTVASISPSLLFWLAIIRQTRDNPKTTTQGCRVMKG
jgi:hypothetical protein